MSSITGGREEARAAEPLLRSKTLNQPCRDIGALTPLAQQACDLFLAECKRRGISIFITETYRSQARQDYLYEQGRTRPGNIVTWTRNSNHTGRMAWDIAVNPPLALYDYATLHIAGQAAKDLGITWGGEWDTPDRPHFEITKDWKPPEEEGEPMEERYQTIDQVPEWGKGTVRKLTEKGIFADPKLLNLTEDMLRLLVFHDRLGIYG